MSIQSGDVKVYLTGITVDGSHYDGGSSQSNPKLSLGGFRSSTEINGSTVLSTAITASATTIQVDDVAKLPGASPLNPAYAVIGSEMIRYNARSTSLGAGYLIGVVRGVNGRVPSTHEIGDVITGVTSQNLFDHVRASENVSGDIEYRCFSVLNTNSADTAFNVSVYLTPVSWSGTATSATSSSNATLTEAAIIGQYANDFFNSGILTITGGNGYSPTPSQNIYNITDYDDSLGKFTISTNWNVGTPNTSTTYVVTSTKASPNPYDTISFAIERHHYAKLDGCGVVSVGGQTYLVDDNLSGAGWTSPLHFIGAYIMLLTGDGVDGVPKRITGYNEVTGRIDISGTFVNTGASMGDLYTIVRGPTRVQLSSEGEAPPVGTGNISAWSTSTSLDTALSINVNSIGEDLSHDELFFVWIKRAIAPNNISYTNDNIIPSIYFEV
jgi:hypothetical protein